MDKISVIKRKQNARLGCVRYLPLVSMIVFLTLCTSCAQKPTPIASVRDMRESTPEGAGRTIACYVKLPRKEFLIAGRVVLDQPDSLAVLAPPPGGVEGLWVAFYRNSDELRELESASASEKTERLSCYTLKDDTGYIMVATKGPVPKVGSSMQVKGYLITAMGVIVEQNTTE